MTDDRHFGKKFQTLCTPLMAANTVVLKAPEWFGTTKGKVSSFGEPHLK